MDKIKIVFFATLLLQINQVNSMGFRKLVIEEEYNRTFTQHLCKYNKDCYPNGFCGDDNFCQCNKCFLDNLESDEICTTKLIPILAPFLISFFIGSCGFDHCFLSGCTCPGVMIGILKAITIGGIGIWWLCDWIFIATNNFSDRYPSSYDQICEHWTN